MKTEQDYLNMQRHYYEAVASKWSLDNREPVVGSYDAHNAWGDYDEYLFKGFDTNKKVALEYGCGPGRNLIRFRNRFLRIDGVDIAKTNLDKAVINLSNSGITNSKLFLCDGRSIPVEDASYDVVFSVICLQHIASHTIRNNIFKDVYRVLVSGGYFCFQMGYGGKSGWKTSNYYADDFNATTTNGFYDTVVTNTKELHEDLYTIGFHDFRFDIRPTGPGDMHKSWIWVRVQK